MLFLSQDFFAQTCFEYYKENCKPDSSNYSYQINDNATGFLLSSGEMHQLPLTLIQKKDYRITICCDAIFEGIIHVEIRNEQGKSLYANSSHNFELNMEFSNQKTQNVFFEITVPEIKAGNGDPIYVQGCIGILIEEMTSVQTGF